MELLKQVFTVYCKNNYSLLFEISLNGRGGLDWLRRMTHNRIY